MTETRRPGFLDLSFYVNAVYEEYGTPRIAKVWNLGGEGPIDNRPAPDKLQS